MFSSKVFVSNAIFHDDTSQYVRGGITLDWSKICFTGNISFTANKCHLRKEKEEHCIQETCKENSCLVKQIKSEF